MGLNIAQFEKYIHHKGEKQFPFYVQRDDLLHPLVSGNKWRKLKGWVDLYNRGEYLGIMTFGGAFSNHLLATAAAFNGLGIPCLGIVRGDEGFDNHYLQECRRQGMHLNFVSRTDYKDKVELAKRFEAEQRKLLVIPEGGKGEPGTVGFQELVESWKKLSLDIVVHASATATTALGLAKHLLPQQKVLSVMVLKNRTEQEEAVQETRFSNGIEFLDAYHFGGYAKTTAELSEFVTEMNNEYPFDIEPVYTGKAFYALLNEILPLYRGKNIMFLHTGGLWNHR